MVQRFQIEEIIVQDTDGITFRAVDTATDVQVAVRRFFPFGSRGGGLQEEEQTAYTIAIGRLAGVRHPALRSVVVGGCDPIDGIPFIATEWIEGELLADLSMARKFTPEETVELVLRALDTSILLSKVLSDEAVWVETDLQTIVVEGPPGDRGATFWLSPFKWLSGAEAKGYEGIAELIEEVMRWKGRILSDSAGKGLGGWLKWLRAQPPETRLLEVRQSLASLWEQPQQKPLPVADPERKAPDDHAPIPIASGGPGKSIADAPEAGQAVRMPAAMEVKPHLEPPVAPPRRKTGAIFAMAGLVIAIGGAAWWFSQQDVVIPPAPEAAVEKPETDVERVNRRATELAHQTQHPVRADKPADKPVAAKAPAVADAVIPWEQREKFIGLDKCPVTVTGRVLKTGMSKSGKTVYLMFSEDVKAARVGLFLEPKKSHKASLAFFESLVGKEVRASGIVKYSPDYGDRLDIMIDSQEAVKAGD